MCIIVDTNKLGAFLADPADEDSRPIRKWLDRGAGSIVYSTSGKFAQEIQGRVRARLAGYARAGKAKLIPESRFADDERNLKAHPDLRSDDPHVLALARAAGVRLLYTADRNLISDFTDKRFIDQPRGKVYSSKRNARRLLIGSACKSPRRGSVR